MVRIAIKLYVPSILRNSLYNIVVSDGFGSLIPCTASGIARYSLTIPVGIHCLIIVTVAS